MIFLFNKFSKQIILATHHTSVFFTKDSLIHLPAIVEML